MIDRNTKWMTISGTAGILLFVVANFTDFFAGSNVLAGLAQLCVNAFVFVIWSRAFMESRGTKKFAALFGVVVPIVLACVTIWRVLVPFIL